MARKWTEQPLDNTLKETDQILRVDLDEVDPSVQNRRNTNQALREWLDIDLTQEVYVDPQSTYTTYADGTISRPYNDLQDAIDSISDASASKKYVIVLAAGELTGAVALKDYISIRGSGLLTTKIIGNVTVSTTDIGDMLIKDLTIQGTLTLANTGSVAGNLALDYVFVTGATILTGRGAGVDNLELHFVRFTNSLTLRGFNGIVHDSQFSNAVTIEDAGTIADSNGDFTSIIIYTTTIANTLDVTASAANPVRATFLGCYITPGVVTLTGDDVTAIFDVTSFPSATIVIGGGSPTIIYWNFGDFVSGPDDSEDDEVAVYDGITGKIIKRSGAKIEDGPTGGSIMNLTIFASTPVGLEAGDTWFEEIDADNISFKWFDGTDTFSVVLGKE